MRPSCLAPPEVWALLSLNLRRRPEQYPARVFGVKSLSLLWGFSCYVRNGRLCVREPRSRRICPVAFDDDVTEAPEFAPDLSVSAPPSTQEELALASVLSPEQELFRQQLFSSLLPPFTASAAPGAKRTYVTTLRAVLPKVTLKLGRQVLPMISARQFCSFFGPAVLLGPKSPSP